MKEVLGVVLIIVGAAIGIYAGFVWAFVGGIVDVIVAIRADELVVQDVATGIAKIICSGVIGVVSFIVASSPGFMIFMSDDDDQ